MTKRQPKGTPTGGQFASERKPEGGELPTQSVEDSDTLYTPEVEAEFDAIWRGEKPGFSESRLNQELSYYRGIADSLGNKDVPSVKSGRGDTPDGDTFVMARHWVDQKIGDTLRAIATHGRSNRVNQMNVVENLLAKGIAPEWVKEGSNQS